MIYRLLLLTLLYGVIPSASARTWVDATGRQVEAGFVRQTEDSVVMRLTNGTEVTVGKDRLSPADHEFLELMASKKEARSFPVNPSERAGSPWYYVAEAEGLFTPPQASANWMVDTGRSSIEPTSIVFPIVVAKGVQRFFHSRTKERIVVLGTDSFELLQSTAQLELFKTLKVMEQQAVMAVLSANYLEHGKASRSAIAPLLADSAFQAKSTKDQKDAFLLALEKSSPDLNREFELSSFQETSWNERWQKEARYTTFQIDTPTVAWQTKVKVEDATEVTLFSLKENDAVGLDAIRKGLSCLPPEMVEYLDVISLHYKGDGFWWGGGQSIYYVAPQDLKFNGSLVYVMAHEVGHCIQHQKVQGTWNEALQNCIVFPSAYGLTNPAEDFAEFAAIVTRAWVDPHLMIEIEEIFPWRHAIYTKALGYKRAKSRSATKLNDGVDQ